MEKGKRNDKQINTNNSIGEKLKILRKARGLTQQDVADRFGVARGTISNHEIGRRKPSISELQKYCKLYGVDLGHFEYVETSKDELIDILARARRMFENDEIPKKTKEKLYRELTKLFIDLGE